MNAVGHSHVPQLSAAEAIGLLRQGALLVDVRENDEWQAGHAPGATHIPASELAARVSHMTRSRQMVIICRSGRRSDHAAAALRQEGYDAYNFSGGMRAWQQAGGVVLTPTGQPGSVI